MTTDQLAAQAALAAFFTWAFEHIKKAPWAPWVGEHAPAMSRVLATVFAALVSAGFTYSWSGSPETGWTGQIFVPPFSALTGFAQTFALQFFGQKLAYKGMYGIPGKDTPEARIPPPEPAAPQTDV